MCSVSGIGLLYDVDTEPDVGLYSVRVHGAGIAQLAYGLAYGLDDPGFDFRYGKEIFLVSKTGSGAHPTSFQFRGAEAAGW